MAVARVTARPFFRYALNIPVGVYKLGRLPLLITGLLESDSLGNSFIDPEK